MATGKAVTRRNGKRNNQADPAKILTGENGAAGVDAPKRLIPFDLGRRRAHKTSEVVLFDPLTRKDTGIRIGISSVYSKEARDAARAAAERQAIANRAKGRPADADDDAEEDEEDAEVQSNIVEQTIGVTKYWFHADTDQPQRPDGTWVPLEGFEDVLLIDGKRLSCTPDNVRKLYTDPELNWIQRRVQDWYLEIQNFFFESKAESSASPYTPSN